MSDTWGDTAANGVDAAEGFGAGNDTFADEEVVQEDTGRIQEDKINKKKLAELEDDGRMLSIFVRPSKKSGHVPYTAVKDIPLSVAMICSNLLFETFRKGNKYYIIEDPNLAPYNFIFEWIKQCADEQNVANIPEIREMATPEKGLQPFIDIMLVAQKLKIPTASFNKFMLKKLTSIARDYLIDLQTVSRIFDSGDTDIYALDLQEIAATSIFSHWYDYKLDTEEYDDYMCDLTDMRENIPELDAALHKAVEDKDEFLKKRRQERREKLAAEQSGAGWDAENGGSGGFDGFGTGEDVNTAGAGDDNAWINQGATAASGEWDNTTTAVASPNEWEKNDNTGSGDWADEVNEHVPAPLAAGGW